MSPNCRRLEIATFHGGSGCEGRQETSGLGLGPPSAELWEQKVWVV